ncbi:MAG: type II toxin-antitoxin system RelE/ParE family toxin [Bacteroidales bacterium]|nr:type II toxin-antitoxin system RelE/ParE family toxin [Bacteroidales bacterium]
MYKLTIKKSAFKEINSLPKKVLSNVVEVIDNLAENPRPEGCTKLKGKEKLWRVRTGDYRIVYSIDDKIEIVEINRVRHRKDVDSL